MEIHETLTRSKKGGLWGWAFLLRHAAFFLDPLSSPNLRVKGGTIEIAVFQQQHHLNTSRPMVFCSALPTTLSWEKKKKRFPLQGAICRKAALQSFLEPTKGKSTSSTRATKFPATPGWQHHGRSNGKIKNCRKIVSNTNYLP